MNVIISNTSDKPLYLQIKEQIKEAILKGELQEGDLLPSVRAFANDIGVSVLTTRRVYDEYRQQIKTFRLKYVFLAAKIIKTARTVIMNLSENYPYKEVYEKCLV